MAEINYITIEEAKAIHQATIENSGGGDYGELDTGKLESVLFHIQNDDYYPTFLDKLEHLFFCACKFHCFADGNKRIAITLTRPRSCSPLPGPPRPGRAAQVSALPGRRSRWWRSRYVAVPIMAGPQQKRHWRPQPQGKRP